MLVSRITDLIGGCGISVIVTGSGDTISNGLRVARVGDIGTPHHPTAPHPPVIAAARPKYIVNGRQECSTASICGCGSPVITGSGDHIVGDGSAVYQPPPPEPEKFKYIIIHDCFCKIPFMYFDDKYEVIKDNKYDSLPYHYVCERKFNSVEIRQCRSYDDIFVPEYVDVLPMLTKFAIHVCVLGIYDSQTNAAMTGGQKDPELTDQMYEKICQSAIIPPMNEFKIPKNNIFLHIELTAQPQYIKCPGTNFNKQKLLSYIK